MAVKWLFIVLCISCALADQLPSYIKKCKLNDEKCYVESAQAALPHFVNVDVVLHFSHDTLHEVREDGRKYVKFHNGHHETKNISRAYFDLTNLFNGDKTLSGGLTPCSRKSPDFNECATKEANKFLPKMVEGIKEIGLPPLNPLVLPKLEVIIPGLNIVVTNAEVHGLKSTKVDSCKLDYDGQTIDVEVTLPLVQVVGRYKMDGEIAKIPLTGEGNCNVTVADLHLTYTLKYHTVKHGDGMDYVAIDSSDIKHNTPRVNVHLDNLPLGEAGNKVINDNIDELIKTMGPQITEAFQQVINSILATALGHIPYDALTTE